VHDPQALGVEDDGGRRVALRRPLVGLVLCVVGGTACGLYVSVSMFLVLGCAASCLALALLLVLLRTRVGPRPSRIPVVNVAIYGCVVLVAWCGALARIEPARRVESIAVHPGRADIRGMVSGDPESIPGRLPGLRTWLVSFAMDGVRQGDADWRPGVGRTSIYWNVPHGGRRPVYGERWELTGVDGLSAGGVDGAGGRSRRLRVYSRQAKFLSAGQGSPVKAWRYGARAAAAQHLSRGIEEFTVETRLLQALLLGHRSRLPDEIREMGAATGTLHIFAISGLHVGIVAGLLIVAISAVRVSRVHWIWVLAPLLIAYTLLTGARPSAVRACVMAIVYYLAPGLGRRADIPSALAIAALLILVLDPVQLADVGFIYSFVVVIGLITLYPLIADPMRRWWAADPMRIEKDPPWVRAGRKGLEYVGGLLAISCAAWLSSMPLTAYFFGRFIPVAIVGNVIVIPLAFLIVLSGCLSLTLGSCAGVLAEVFNHACYALVRLFILSIDAISRLPLAGLRIPRPSIGWVVLWYCVLGFAAVYLWDRRFSKRIDTASGG